MSKFHLAQINIAQLIAPQGDPVVADFFANVPRINELAESSPGFVWRFDDDYPDPMIAFNMSLWESIEALSQFVYRSAHIEIFRRKTEWFQTISTANMAMWWIPQGQIPTPEEGLNKLELLNQLGPTMNAFTFAHRFEATIS